jgi:hypothetical protein
MAHPTFPSLSLQGPPAVLAPARQLFSQVFICVAGNFVDARVVVWASMPASFSRTVPKQRRSVLRSSLIPRVKTLVFAACVLLPPAAAHLGCQLWAAAHLVPPLGGPAVRSGARAQL